ncbi:hypothetical protein WNB94_17095 [Aquabacterium sp. A3]|uniref:hypothetical protein n=1 Tax=Aquabacterium sp. A3 TaxID=3132829 RepID=UPI00311A7BBE
MPAKESFLRIDAGTAAWLGQASAVAHGWDPVRSITTFNSAATKLKCGIPHAVAAGVTEALVCLHQIRHELAMQTEQPLSVNLNSGLVFDYFDEIRKVLETANSDLLFIDPYLDAEFVSRYLPHVGGNVNIRLLGQKCLKTLLPAVEVFRQQHAQKIEVRTATGFHDRYIIVDGSTCYQSGSSFKDGAKKAPTTLTEILDAFPAVKATYENLWSTGTQHS